jgi:hypothetical protein
MTTAVGAKARAIDALMERASKALEATDYFEAEALCLRAFGEARERHDFDRCARICLPLQEARRQIRQLACDAGGSVTVLAALPEGRARPSPGMYLIEPPLVGAAAREFRALAARHRVPTMILAREPATRAGKWPVVGVGTGPREPIVVRVQVSPPDVGPDAGWFQATQEALGDAAIVKAPAGVPADHHVDDLADLLEAVPDHEKLIQELARACVAAAGSPVSTVPRRRPLDANPFSF